MRTPAKIMIGCLAVAIIGAIAAAIVFISAASPAKKGDTAPVAFRINPGEGVADIAANLEKDGLIRSHLMFDFIYYKSGKSAKFHPGDYTLNKSMSYSDIMRALGVAPPDKKVRARLLEGWTSGQYGEELEKQGLCSKDEFMAIVRAPGKSGIIMTGHTLDNLEGFMFPDTYYFKPGTDCASAVQKLVNRFFDKFTSEKMEKAQALGLDLRKAVTLASLVEKEAKRSDERKLIAGVILNRLKDGMKLQVDATFMYKNGEWLPDISDPDDPRADPKYNTYKINGLPPGPICNPGAAALDAAVEPDMETKYRFYVTKKDGTGGHYFSETPEGHRNNINLSNHNRRLLEQKQ